MEVWWWVVLGIDADPTVWKPGDNWQEWILVQQLHKLMVVVFGYVSVICGNTPIRGRPL